MRMIEPGVYIAPQIAPTDVAGLAAAGVRVIVNNRPDGEERRQPAGAAIRAASEAAGVTYMDAPVAGGISAQAVGAMGHALAGEGPVVAFCKSGMRSALVWAVVRAAEGRDVAALLEAARGAGVELGAYRGMLVGAGAAQPDS